MGVNLFLTAGVAPSGTPLPGNAQALLAFIAQYTGITGAANFNGLNFGSTTPSPEQRDQPWFKTDTFGNPIGLFSWNGTAWVVIPTQVAYGATSGRPSNPSPGSQYFDSTIGCAIVWNGSNWTTLSGTIGDVKEVQAVDLNTALTNNPGWVQDTASIGLVIGGAGGATALTAAHSYGAVIGEEAHQLLQTELASHIHAMPYGTFPGAFQNGSQAPGVSPAVTPGSTAIAVQSVTSTGGDQPHNNIQPTIYYWRLVKTS